MVETQNQVCVSRLLRKKTNQNSVDIVYTSNLEKFNDSGMGFECEEMAGLGKDNMKRESLDIWNVTPACSQYLVQRIDCSLTREIIKFLIYQNIVVTNKRISFSEWQF